MKTATLQRHRSHWYQIQINLKQNKHVYRQIIHFNKFKMWLTSYNSRLRETAQTFSSI